MEITGEDENGEEEYYYVKNHELFNGVSEYFNNAKLSDITLIVGNQQ
jgi:hypothetical protein